MQTDTEFLLKDETFKIIGICMEVHRILGHGFLEIVYKDAIEYELYQKGLHFSRESEYKIMYKENTLPHKFYADFTIVNKLILEVKAVEGGLGDHFIAQTINYLKASGCKVGLLVNFGRTSLEYKRLIF